MLYNIAPSGKSQLYTAEQIRTASENGLRLFLNVGNRYPAIECRLAATVNGWCTVVLKNGSILQEWAGSFTVKEA